MDCSQDESFDLPGQSIITTLFMQFTGKKHPGSTSSLHTDLELSYTTSHGEEIHALYS